MLSATWETVRGCGLSGCTSKYFAIRRAYAVCGVPAAQENGDGTAAGFGPSHRRSAPRTALSGGKTLARV
jgi:hypothetical protein